MDQTRSFYDNFIIWSSSVTLTFNLPKEMIQMNNCAKLSRNMRKCIRYSSDKIKLWSFYHLTFKFYLDLQPTWTNVSNDTATPKGEQLCQIILKSMQKCIGFGPDKLNLWPFQHLTFKYDSDLQPSWANVLKLNFYSSGTATVPNYFEIHA